MKEHDVKLTRRVKLKEGRVSLEVTLWATGLYSFEPPSATCPGGEWLEVTHLEAAIFELDIDHDDFELVGEDWRGCSADGGYRCIELEEQTAIVDYLEAWGIDYLDGDWEIEE